MNQYLLFFIVLPLLGYLLSVLPTNEQEKTIFRVAIATVGLHLVAGLGLLAAWAGEGFPNYFLKVVTLYQTHESEFSVDLYADRNTFVYLLVSGAITFLVSIFSRYYMHRERGFKRFYNNLLFFFFGLNIIIFAGNFETLFIGWEIIGVTSFFLIAFYRDRYLPVKNALKVVSIYRLADICLLLGIWMNHHAFHKNITFPDLANLTAQHTEIIAGATFQLVIPAVFLIAALVKSAQLPFSSWLPRAMEGPTTSSAIFYGSLSVHMGVFLLIRTMPLWEDNTIFRTIVVVLGVLTSFVATTIARVQSSVKTQIAYSSIAQIALMFIEVALGFPGLALFHFVGNAFLRTYQLLVSPSVLNYLIHDQFFNFIPPQHDNPNTLWGRIKLSLYVLGIREWGLDTFLYRYCWMPFKRIGRLFHFIGSGTVMLIFVPIFLVGLYLVYHEEHLTQQVARFLPEVFACISLIIIMRAFVERRDARSAWLMVVVSQFFTSLLIGFNDEFGPQQIAIYLSGIFVSAMIGFASLRRLTSAGESVSLDRFHGHSYERPRLTIMFLLAALGLSGFPITPTFIGEDVFLGSINQDQTLLTILTALNLILDGLAIYRIYVRVFLGPHLKGYHEVAYRSS